MGAKAERLEGWMGGWMDWKVGESKHSNVYPFLSIRKCSHISKCSAPLPGPHYPAFAAAYSEPCYSISI